MVVWWETTREGTKVVKKGELAAALTADLKDAQKADMTDDWMAAHWVVWWVATTAVRTAALLDVVMAVLKAVHLDFLSVASMAAKMAVSWAAPTVADSVVLMAGHLVLLLVAMKVAMKGN
jgi:hypothetical protein